MTLDDAVLKLRYYNFDPGKFSHYVDKGSNDILSKYNRTLALFFDKNFQLYENLLFCFLSLVFFFNSGFSLCLLFYVSFVLLDYHGISFS